MADQVRKKICEKLTSDQNWSDVSFKGEKLSKFLIQIVNNEIEDSLFWSSSEDSWTSTEVEAYHFDSKREAEEYFQTLNNWLPKENGIYQINFMEVAGGRKIHRDNFGMVSYYFDGKLHREDGPAVTFPNGDKHWFFNGKLHRLDGPAVEYINGKKKWFLNDAEVSCNSQGEFEKLIKLTALW